MPHGFIYLCVLFYAGQYGHNKIQKKRKIIGEKQNAKKKKKIEMLVYLLNFGTYEVCVRPFVITAIISVSSQLRNVVRP